MQAYTITCCLLALLYCSATDAWAKSTSYYLSQEGSDTSSGTSAKTPWRSLAKLNSIRLHSGDKIYLEGGATFEGTLILDEEDAGFGGNVLHISSYGRGKAKILAGTGRGIWIYNTGGVHLQNLIVQGAGVGTNNTSGIECLVDKPDLQPKDIVIDSCEAIGFHLYGILINADKSEAAAFQRVRITRCVARENGEAGIGSLAYYPAISHKNIYVGNCKAYRNKGILRKTNNHSGNGIVLSGVDGCLIEHCEAYENGADNRSTGGGPVGIWLWNCRNGIIQACESHHNYAGLLTDGGGFDIDGGSSDCIIRRCYSHDNEGAGYLLCEFGAPNPFKNNSLRNNVSRNDGLKNAYGGITLAGAGDNYPLVDCKITRNRIYVSGENIVNEKPYALFFLGDDFRGMRFRNNRFEVKEKGALLRCERLFDDTAIFFKGNTYTLEDKEKAILCRNCDPNALIAWEKILR